MREKQSYRDNLARLNEVVPYGELLNVAQVAQVLGVSRDTAAKMTFAYRIPGTRLISKASLARLIST